MPTIYRTYQRRMHGGSSMKNVHTAITYGVSSHNNIPVSVYECGPCIASCMSVEIRLQRRNSSGTYVTVGSRLNKELCDSRVGPGRVDETFTNVIKSNSPMRVLWKLDGITSISPVFYHK